MTFFQRIKLLPQWAFCKSPLRAISILLALTALFEYFIDDQLPRGFVASYLALFFTFTIVTKIKWFNSNHPLPTTAAVLIVGIGVFLFGYLRGYGVKAILFYIPISIINLLVNHLRKNNR